MNSTSHHAMPTVLAIGIVCQVLYLSGIHLQLIPQLIKDVISAKFIFTVPMLCIFHMLSAIWSSLHLSP